MFFEAGIIFGMVIGACLYYIGAQFAIISNKQKSIELVHAKIDNKEVCRVKSLCTKINYAIDLSKEGWKEIGKFMGWN